jgi:hypothetical protein
METGCECEDEEKLLKQKQDVNVRILLKWKQGVNVRMRGYY